jgi:S-methylmethionine-dependent homocysteine/selenocysteine methylase
MSSTAAQGYHAWQIAVLAEAGANLVSAYTLNYSAEALGIVLAAQAQGIAVVISFTLEVDGCLPSGETLAAAIAAVDEGSQSYPLYYMINCAHPSHVEPALTSAGGWKLRIRGMRGNASRCSHAELDAATALDAGNPLELGADYRRLQQLLPALRVYGGCCGTDLRHVQAIASACLHS